MNLNTAVVIIVVAFFAAVNLSSIFTQPQTAEAVCAGKPWPGQWCYDLIKKGKP